MSGFTVKSRGRWLWVTPCSDRDWCEALFKSNKKHHISAY